MNYKTIIAPFIGVIVITVKMLFGIDIPESVQNEVVDVLTSGIAIALVVYGIIKNHFNK